MFDSILKRNTLPKTKYGTGLCIALSLHVATLCWVLWRPTPYAGPTPLETEVVLYRSLPQNLHPLPGGGMEMEIKMDDAPPPKPPSQPQKLQKPKTPLTHSVLPAKKPLEKTSAVTLADGSESTHPLSEKYGAEGGDPNTHFNPAIHGSGGPVTHSLGVIPFGEGMTPPKLIADAHPIRFSREALEARVEGRAVVRCRITAEGNVENCRFIQRLPYMDEAILSALYMRKYSPATYQGQKISVDYNIPIRLKLP